MIVGLTGGIGSGKSKVLLFFKDLGAITYVADVEAKKLMNSDKELKVKISNLFGENAYQNNMLNKKYIADIVFNDSVKLNKLNHIVHPKVLEHFLNFVNKHLNEIIIYESAILFESGSNKLCNYVITVVADYKTKINRVMLRDNTTEEKIIARMKYQSDDKSKIDKANFVINNTLLEHTKNQVVTVYSLLQKMNA